MKEPIKECPNINLKTFLLLLSLYLDLFCHLDPIFNLRQQPVGFPNLAPRTFLHFFTGQSIWNSETNVIYLILFVDCYKSRIPIVRLKTVPSQLHFHYVPLLCINDIVKNC